jgi:prevent-host-death family protein
MLLSEGGDYMQTMGISQFKSHALKILDQVAKTQESIVITKRGKPLAQIIPYRNSISNHTPGKLADALVFENDIVSPLGEEMWDACK